MSVQVIEGDCRAVLPTLLAASVHCCITSPPYWGLRDYGLGPDCFGLEPTIDLYVQHSVEIFREVRRVLRDDATFWLNLGDSFANKQLQMIPARVALALQADGWYLRSEIVWAKPNPMPESVTDRPTSSHEKIFLLAKSAKYWYDADAVREPAIYSGLANQDESGFKDPRSFNGKHKAGYRSSGKQRGHSRRHAGFNDRWDQMSKAEQQANGRNLRNVWTFATEPFPDAHFATYPTELVKRCILAGCPKGGMVLDPFGGSGTTGLVADRLERSAILIEAKPDYVEMARRRIASDAPLFASSPAPQGAAS